MLQEPFAIGNSFVHQLDPRMRLLITGAFAIVVALSYDFRALTAALFVSLLLVLCAQLPARRLLKRILMVNGLIAIMWIVLPLTFQGPSAATFGPLTFYHAGIVLAAQITLKSNAIVLTLIALITTMNFSVIGYALNWLKVPPKACPEVASPN